MIPSGIHPFESHGRCQATIQNRIDSTHPQRPPDSKCPEDEIQSNNLNHRTVPYFAAI